MNVMVREKAGAVRTPLAVIAEKALATFHGGVPDEVMHAARRCLVDWLGVALAGMNEAPTRTLRTALVKAGGASAAAPGGSPYFDALVWGTAGHALDYDDTDYVNLIHVSSTLFPALFALADQRAIDGHKLLKAFIAGFEAEDRAGYYLGRKLTKQGWHVSGVIGHLGSPLSASLALALPAPQIEQAMAISATAASGLIAAFGTMSKPLQLGRAAADGLVAALLAEQGFTGPTDLLAADPGITRPFLGERIGDWSTVETSWGAPYAILLNSFKPHASCMITHPIIDAASGIRGDMQADHVSCDDLQTVGCEVNPLAPKVAGYTAPRTGLEGKFSVAYCCALGLLHGSATPDRFAEGVVQSADMQRLLPKVSVEPRPEIGEQQAVVTVQTVSGRTYRRETKMAKGNPENPLSDEDLNAKFVALAEPVLGGCTRSIAESLWSFDGIENVCRWFKSARNAVRENA